MRIIRFEAENIKKLRCVAINPEGNVVEIAGPNGSGKSSVLDAIWYALGGGQVKPELPVRKGALKAQVSLDLGEIKVLRTFTEHGTSSLRVESANGERIASPQGLLDSLVGNLTFDPLRFARMKPAEQLEELKGLVRIDADLEGIEKQNQSDFDERTDVNREAKALRSRADAISILPDLPEVEIDVDSLVAKLEEVGAKNLERQRVLSGIENQKNKALSARKESERLSALSDETKKESSRLAKLSEEAARKAEELLEASKKLMEESNSIQREAERVLVPAVADAAPLKEQISKAREVNRSVQAHREKKKLVAEAEALERKSSELTRQIENREETKRAAIESAQMPIRGLAFGNGMVLLHGIPSAQASSAEQLRVSTAMAMSANPKLRIIRIQDGSLLDLEGMKTLEAMAKENDFQIWIERVSGATASAVVMEDGEIKSKEGK